MRACWLLLLLAACVETDLARCGDKLCPVGTRCMVDRCVRPDQLAACSGHEPDDACTVGGAVGRCIDGVCEFRDCGNGVIEGDEVCDDTNRDDGDGCASDCLSLEICGNGIVDVAETCDCGSAAADKPETCRFTNSDDIEAECSATCTPRFCGDGVRNALEQCDGAQLDNKTCGDFGYYRGTLACSNLCRFAPETSCDGTCGDGQVEPAFGEFCDTDVLPPGSCITYGFDAGHVTCAPACSPDVARCERFGWQRLHDRRVIDLWANETQVLVVTANDTGTADEAFIVINGIADAAMGGPYHAAAGSGSTAYAIGATEIAVWSGTAWSTMGVGWSSGTPVSATYHEQHGLYVALSTGAVWRFDGAWTDQGLSQIVEVTSDDIAVFARSTTNVRTSAGGAWTDLPLPPTGTGPIQLFVPASKMRAWLQRGGQLFRLEQANWVPMGLVTLVHGAATAQGDLVAATAAGTVHRMFVNAIGDQRALVEDLRAPISAYRVAVSPDHGVVVGGMQDTYRLRTGAWELEAVDATTPGVTENAVGRLNINSHAEPILVGEAGPWAPKPNGGYQPLFQSDPKLTGTYVSDGAFDRNSKIYLAAREGIYSVESKTLVIPFGGAVGEPYTTMTVARDGELLAGGNGRIARDQGGWHEILVPTCNVKALARAMDAKIYAICAGPTDKVFTIDENPTTIAQVAGLDVRLETLWVSEGGIIVAIGDSAMYIHANGVWTPHSIPHMASAWTVSGTAPDDVFVGGLAAPFSDGTGLAHWDGARFTPVRLLSGGGNITRLHVTERSITYVNNGSNVYDITRFVIW